MCDSDHDDDRNSDTSDFGNFTTYKTTEHIKSKHDSDTASTKSTDDEKQSQQNIKIHRVPSGNHIEYQDDSFLSESPKSDPGQGNSNTAKVTENVANGEQNEANDTTVDQTVNEVESEKIDKKEMGNVKRSSSQDSDEEDLDRKPNIDLDKIEY